jgi:hypothetical protein
MNVKEYVLSRLDQGERDLNVLARQARIQFPSVRVAFSYIRAIRNEWQRTSTNRRPRRTGHGRVLAARATEGAQHAAEAPGGTDT